jgi:MFS family permease
VDPTPQRVRRKLLTVLFVGSGLARTGFIAAVTVSSLVAEDVLGSASLAGVPSAAATIGVAAGTAPIAALMARRGRRPGVALGMTISAGGALVAALAIGLRSFPLFVLGMLTFGVGNAGDRLARYAAADVSPAHRRSFAISLVVWAGTIGSVIGPILLEPVEAAAEALGMEGLAGAPLLAAVATSAAALLAFTALRPDPLEFVDQLAPERRRTLVEVRPLLRTPAVRYAIVALIIGQVVMVLIMTMTPVHIRRAGEDLGIVGLVIGAHTFGMFALSPVTGLLADRIGRFPIMLLGQGVLVVSAVMAAGAGGADRVLLVVSLFLLGFGWNLGFVAGSAYLTEGAPTHLRVPLQGVADAVVWTSAAVASISSGVLLEATGYATLSIVGAAMVIVPVALMFRYGTVHLRTVPSTGT